MSSVYLVVTWVLKSLTSANLDSLTKNIKGKKFTFVRGCRESM